jgi:hypothetical protein
VGGGRGAKLRVDARGMEILNGLQSGSENMAPSSQRRSRPASALALWAAILFVAGAVCDMVVALSTAAELSLLDGARFGVAIPRAQAEAFDARQRLLAGVQLGIALPAAVLFFVWVYRTNRTARALGAQGMTYSPGWSVVWFFIPLMNLFIPYDVMRELWKASRSKPGEDWRQVAISPLLGTWWAACVAGSVIHYSPLPVLMGQRRLVDVTTHGMPMGDMLWEWSWGLLIADVVGIATRVLTVAILILITDFQQQKQALVVELDGSSSLPALHESVPSGA